MLDQQYEGELKYFLEDLQDEQDEQDEPQFKKKVFCIQCARTNGRLRLTANYYESRQLNKFHGISRESTCIIMWIKQIATSPIEPAHMIKEPSYANAETKNKNNDCQDFIWFRNQK